MVKCGNCNESHATAAEVRDCYRKDGKTKARHEQPMSSKQRDYIDSLIDTLSERSVLQEEVAGIVSYFESTYLDPTVGEASNLIEVLSNLRWLTPAPVEDKAPEQEPITFTEDEQQEAASLCPRCGAEGSEPCKTKSGNEASVPHTGRYTTAS